MTNKPSLVNRCEPIPGMKQQCFWMHTSWHGNKNVKRKIYLWKRGDFDKVRMDISEFVADFVQTNTVNASVDQLWSG